MNDANRIPGRDAARRAMPLDGADARSLEEALTATERERDEARAEVERAKAGAAMLLRAAANKDPRALDIWWKLCAEAHRWREQRESEFRAHSEALTAEIERLELERDAAAERAREHATQRDHATRHMMEARRERDAHLSDAEQWRSIAYAAADRERAILEQRTRAPRGAACNACDGEGRIRVRVDDGSEEGAEAEEPCDACEAKP